MDSVKIFQLKQEISKLLEERPELSPLQERLDLVLKSAGTQHNRLVMINQLMMDSMNDLKSKMESLGLALDRLGRIKK